MSITATSAPTTPKELIPEGNYVARCYQMIHIGTVEETVMGKAKILNKVRIGWELPTELKVFDEKKGEQPLVISKEFTLSMYEKANLRKILTSWRGKAFTEDEARSFDITKLLGATCMLQIVHKPSAKDPTKIYEEIASVSTVPKGLEVPKAINKIRRLEYDNWNEEVFNSLPDFIKQKIEKSEEYKAMRMPQPKDYDTIPDPVGSDLPF